MLPREIINRSWRPVSGTLKLPPTQKLLCVFTSGKIANNKKATIVNNKTLSSASASASASSSSHSLKFASNLIINSKNNNFDRTNNKNSSSSSNGCLSASTNLLRAAPCHSEEAVIQQTQQHINSSTPLIPILDMPTPLIEEGNKPNQNQEKTAGTGNPQQRGHRKFNPWLKRNGPKEWAHSRVMSLDFARLRRGPPTPTFPEGVPITRIRMFKHMQNATGTNVKFRKHKVYNSLKRGR